MKIHAMFGSAYVALGVILAFVGWLWGNHVAYAIAVFFIVIGVALFIKGAWLHYRYKGLQDGGGRG